MDFQAKALVASVLGASVTGCASILDPLPPGHSQVRVFEVDKGSRAEGGAIPLFSASTFEGSGCIVSELEQVQGCVRYTGERCTYVSAQCPPEE